MTDEARGNSVGDPLTALRQRVRRASAKAEERCNLCGEVIGPEHRHLLNLTSREVFCACRTCALLFDAPTAGAGARRLIPTRSLYLADFDMTDAQWDSLQIPVEMAFFSYSAAAQRMTAFYPSPMGPMESLLPLDAWDEITKQNPLLQQMEPEVEALLVHRERNGSDYYLVPIDVCYKLVGLIRFHWSGISGGEAVRQEIARFFADLKAKSLETEGKR